jgi:hypothetical protein
VHRAPCSALLLVSVLSHAALASASTTANAAEAFPGMKSESTATTYSIGGTVVPILAGAAVASVDTRDTGGGGAAVLILSGYIAGPSAGHFYAGRPGRALLGVGIRSAALVGVAYALTDALDEEGDSSPLFGTVCLLGGVSSMLIDMGDAAKSARIHNEKIRQQRASLLPAMIGQRRAPGVRLDVAF